MTDPQVPPAGTFYISGGMVNVGGSNPSFTQHNYYSPDTALIELRKLLDEIGQRLGEFRDPDAARGQVETVRTELARRDPDGRSTVQGALTSLAALALAGTAVADFVTKAANLVTQYWPF